MVCALVLAFAAAAVLGVLVLRLWTVLRSQDITARKSLNVLIVAGSGGHTTEILRLVGSLSRAYSPRHYVIADSDVMSTNKIKSFELTRADGDSSAMIHFIFYLARVVLGVYFSGMITRTMYFQGLSVCERIFAEHGTPQHSEYYIHRIPRSREVRQSWLSSVFTTLRSMWLAFPLVHLIKPDLVLCNGPGTCVPICISALLLGILGIKKVIVVYIESICRVETLSLSGKILLHLSHHFIVQWPALKEKYPKSVYLGRIV